MSTHAGQDVAGPPVAGGRLVKLDTHVHSQASSGPVYAALGLIGCPESYSEPERVFDQAKARGMDLVALTDHDTIDGAMTLVERGFPGLVVGEEVTVYFPEDRCKLHVLVWGLTPELHEEIGALGLRDDVYAFARWLRHNTLAHALAHPLYVQNKKLTRWHLDRCALLFKGFEVLNGAHAGTHRAGLERYLAALTPGKVHRLIQETGLEPLWPRIWEKARTAGSDDHALLNVGRTWTAVEQVGDEAVGPREFFRELMACRSSVGGVAGHASLLAHQITTVGAEYYARRLAKRSSATGRYAAHKLLRFAGVHVEPPGRARLALDLVRSRLTRKRRRAGPLVEALRASIGPLLERYPDLAARLSPGAWTAGSAFSEHERMGQFFDELYTALHRALAPRTRRAFLSRSRPEIADQILSYAVLELAQLPYYFSLFHQNKEQSLVDRLEHECAEPGSGVSILERPMKVLLFSDTVADVNGPSRFIQNVAEQARRSGRELTVFTSTRLRCPDASNIVNFEPVVAGPMPRYDQLEIVLPPLMKMLRAADALRPDVVHISTPGPVGLAGFIAAKMLKAPMLGVYHTDFPAYVEKLFDDDGLGEVTRQAMRLFYSPFSSIFTRSEDYVASLRRIGIRTDRLVPLKPGIDTDLFHASKRDPSVWAGVPGVSASSVKVVYVGRVSVEKNLPMITPVWKRVRESLRAMGRGPDQQAELIIIGDGPYRKQMQEELRGQGVHFAGFRFGEELARMYASADLFVFPSTTDTLGQVVMESQSCGLPALVTDVGGPKEMVIDGVTGLVLPAEDGQAWAERIVRLVTDEPLRRSMGRAAHEHMKRFSIASSFEHWWAVHEQVRERHLASVGIARPGSAGPASPAPQIILHDAHRAARNDEQAASA